MSEQPISISNLNDFLFCPVSIYFHALDEDAESLLAQDTFQINGSAAHSKSDTAAYSTRRTMLQGISVYCEKYGLIGKIDTFDAAKGILTERKKHINAVYDGFIYQLYAQYFALEEMGYGVKQLRLYSMDDNKVYPVALPQDNAPGLAGFEQLVADMNSFDFEGFKQQNPKKCARCIYEPLCSYCADKEQ